MQNFEVFSKKISNAVSSVITYGQFFARGRGENIVGKIIGNN